MPDSSHTRAAIPQSVEPLYDLTVVTVCRNVLPELQKTLPSVLAQKAKGSLSIEHLIIDGASTDGTPAWLEARKAGGEIEAYLSEPDKGIYDAMNKGIALARGRVITFMNAGDTYADEDIVCCVRPLLENTAKSAVGAALYLEADGSLLYQLSPQLSRAYIDIIGCHQAYFFDTAATRAIGGYDDGAFRSAADLELMNAMMRQFGAPYCTDTVVAHFYMGGYSENCWEKRRHEFVEIQYRSWEQIQERCRKEPDFTDMITAMLARHCLLLGNGTAIRGEHDGRVQAQLQHMIATHARPKPLLLRRLLLKLALKTAFAETSARRLKVLLLHIVDYLCAADIHNPLFPNPAIGRRRKALPQALLHSLVCRFVIRNR